MTEYEKLSKGASFASLILNDAALPINVENLTKLLKAAKITTNDKIFAVFEQFFKTTPITNFIGAVGGSAPAGAAPAAASSAPKKEEKKKVEEEAPKEEEADMDMGDLFG